MKFKVFTIAGQLSLVSDQLISHISLASVFRIPIYTKSSKHRSIIYSHLYVSFVGPCYISSAIDVSFSAIWAVDGCGGGYVVRLLSCVYSDREINRDLVDLCEYWL